MTRRRVVLLGSTGSIGRQTLDVIATYRERFEVIGLSAGSDAETLARQASEWGVPLTGLGPDEAVTLAALPDADVVVNAIVGAAGLRASLAALRAGKTLALANKESLVAAGELCRAAAAEGGGTIVPVDSEHAALAQCLEGRAVQDVRKVLVTASGGPLRTRPDLAGVTREEALAHPTWSMGPKITIDSATLMNKALEVIEAHSLFGFPYDQIEVVVHPQSVIHAAAELLDGSLVMSAAAPDMRLPIAAALAYPERLPSDWGTLRLAEVASLTFEPVDGERFPAVELGYLAGRRGGTHPAVLNAANEIAVNAFLADELPFAEIVPIVREVLERHGGGPADALEPVLGADMWAREAAAGLVAGRRAGARGSE